MRRVALLLFALLIIGLGASTSARAADPPSLLSSTIADFDALVKKGDQARVAGKWSVALKEYAAALELRDDPLVAGRLGLVLMEYREYEVAAGKLFQAIEYGAGANDAERTRFFRAFLIAKKATCRLDLIVVQNGVKLELDGEPRFRNRREFWAFVASGKHKLKASLEGFEDETIEFDAPKGGQLNLTISLRSVKPPEQPPNQPKPQPAFPPPAPPSPEAKPALVVVEDKPLPLANLAPKNGSFVAGIGFGFVFGATPTPAVGPHLFGAWRSESWWEVGMDVRAAWNFVPDERFPETRFVTWSASVTPCGRLRDRWFGCAIAGLDGMTGGSQLKRALLPVFGLRAGREFVLREHVRLQILGDLAAHAGAFAFVADVAAWRGFFLTGGVGARVVYRF